MNGQPRKRGAAAKVLDYLITHPDTTLTIDLLVRELRLQRSTVTASVARFVNT
jgi:uncharacterized protein YigA (DUF484 family)